MMEYLELSRIDKDFFVETEKRIKEKYGIKLEDYKNYDDEEFYQEVIERIIKKNIIAIDTDKGFIRYIEMINNATEYLVKYDYCEKDLKSILENMSLEERLQCLKQDIFCIMSKTITFSQDNRVCGFLYLGYSAVEEMCEFDDIGTRTHYVGLHSYLPIEEKDEISVYLKDFKELILSESFVTIFDCFKREPDITKYGMEKAKQLVNIVRKQGELKNLFLLDRVEGISLTNTIFRSIKKESCNMKSDWLKIVTLIARFDFVYGRNLIAQLLFDYIKYVKFDKEMIKEIIIFMEENISRFNEYYHDIQDTFFWLRLYGIEEDYTSKQHIAEDIKDMELKLKGEWERYLFDNKVKKEIKYKKISRIYEKSAVKRSLYAKIHKAVMQGIWYEKTIGSGKIK